MPKMMKHLLTAIACCLAMAGSAQNTYNHDSDGDGCITVIDVLSVLSQFDTCEEVPDGAVYWYHLGTGVGANDYPFAANLITGTLYLSDNTIAANYGESFTDMLANPSVYQTVNTQSGISDGDQFVFGTSNSSNFFWIAIAESLGVPDLTTNARLADTNNNISDVAQAKLAFTHNGLAYTLYLVNLASTANGVTIQYNE
jgi:hypothetical protein